MVRLFWVAVVLVFVGASAAVFMRGDGEGMVVDGGALFEPGLAAPATGAVPAAELVPEVVEEVVAEERAVVVETPPVDESTDAVGASVDQVAVDMGGGASLDALLGIEEEDEEVDRSVGATLLVPEQALVPELPNEDLQAGAGGARAVDGGAVLGERFEVPGDGSAEHPYVIGWEVLVSAQETYRPRQGKNDIPAWLQQIDGKYVRIDGFIVLPVMGGVMDEVLLARNEWDGCCIGVPPTAYDSVEVGLRTDGSQVGGRHAVNYGSIVGKIKIDPYLWKDWLISMYVMEDAVIERQGL